MREHAASSPERKAELAALLRSGAVTQAAINHAGHCDGGARGVAAYPPPASPSAARSAAPFPLPPQPPFGRLSAATYFPLVAPLSANASRATPPSAATAACAGMRSRLAMHAAIAEAMRANPNGCDS